MVFHSILFAKSEDGIKEETLAPPDFFVDLNLDQIIDAITAGKQEYNLKPFFYAPLNDIDAIEYRHEILQDLENRTLFEDIKSFAQKMRVIRKQLVQIEKLYYKYQKESWFVDAVEVYCDAVNCLVHDLSLVNLKSRGFLSFREYITNYAKSDRFTVLLAETEQLKDHLSAVQYCLLIKGNKIQAINGVAVEVYCDAVNCLVHDLSLVNLKSRGFLSFREYITNYAKSDRFTVLLAETEQLKDHLSAVQYCLLIKGNKIQVSKYDSEVDYSAEVEKTFEKFKQGAVKDYRVEFPDWPDMNPVEAKILDLVARLYPDVFLSLDNYCVKHSDYLAETIGVFDREFQFYVAYLEFIAMFKRAGLDFCYPKVSNTCKEIYDHKGFDLALAYKLISENPSIVCNDFYLKGKERIFVVSGPNQGGKTTFARTFGQLHYLASIGCLVPGREAQLFLFNGLFTHFEKEENIKDLRGKLEDDLVRIYRILNQATPDSIIILNELFTSTTLKDALSLSKQIMERIIQLDLLCVWTTFVDELASFSEKTVSVVSTVVPENPALRTFKIVRRPADGLAYAISIAEKYQLTYDRLQERIKS